MAGKRVPAPTKIVEESELFTMAEIRIESLTFLDFAFPSEKEMLQWLARRKLIRNKCACIPCQAAMSLIVKRNALEGYYWRCNKCKSTASIRKDTIFANSRLGPIQILLLLYGWSQNYSQIHIAHEAGLGNKACTTTVDWCSFCREIIEHDLVNHPTIIGGLNPDGTSKTVEIDETLFFHRKLDRDESQEGHRVFGGIERESGKCFLVEVPNRNAETLTEIIQTYILPGTIIISDVWRGYINLNKIGGGMYEHQQNYAGFKDKNIHTQNIKNLWMRAKRKLRQLSGTSRDLFPSYIQEVIWRNQYRNSNILAELFRCLHERYSF